MTLQELVNTITEVEKIKKKSKKLFDIQRKIGNEIKKKIR